MFDNKKDHYINHNYPLLYWLFLVDGGFGYCYVYWPYYEGWDG